MAENKKSFILYCDQKEMFEHLPPELCKELLLHLFSYVNDENPTSDNAILNALFAPIKHQLKRDLAKWETRASTSRNNGKLGGRPKTQANPNKPTGLNNNLNEPVKPVNDNVTVNDNVNDNVTVKVNKDNTLLSQVDKSTLDHKTSTYYDIAISFMELFKSNLLELNISTKSLEAAKFKKWVDPIRLLIENDNKSIEEFREVWQFLNDDEFWKQQIRSTEKLRKKDKDGIIYFEVLLIKSRNEQKRKSTSEKSNSGVTDAYKQSIYDRLHGIKSNEEMPQN